MLQKKERIFPIILILVLVLMFILVKPFFVPLLLGIIAAFLFSPLYKLLKRKIKNETLAAGICLIILLIIILILVIFISGALMKQASDIYLFTRDPDLFKSLENCTPKNSFICQSYDSISQLIEQPGFYESFKEPIKNATSFVITKISSFLFSIPNFILSVFVILFSFFYLLKDGKHLGNNVKQLIPLNKHDKKILEDKLKKIMSAVVYGNFLVGLIQGIVAGIGFIIFGVDNAFLWTIIMIILCIIPFVGSWLVWFPVAVYRIVSGFFLQTNQLWLGIGLFLYGVILVGSIDNILRPYLMGRKVVHPVVVLLGVLGGFPLFGIFGVIIGPLLLALSIEFIKLYKGLE